MSLARITIDGEVVLDDDFNQWTTKTPEFVADMIKPGVIKEPQVYVLAAMVAFSKAVAKQEDVVIDVTTGPGGWSMTVKGN